MKEINNILKDYADIALSDKEVLKLVNGKANLILYPDLHKYKSIDEVLYPYGSAFILYESQPNYGHWISVNKINPNTIEYFNSYGGIPDNSLEYINNNFAKKSNQDYPYLAKLMYDSPYNLSFNEYKFQGKKPNIKTCGRHAALRILFKNIPLDNYYKLFKRTAKKFNISFDELVTLLTMYINE